MVVSIVMVYTPLTGPESTAQGLARAVSLVSRKSSKDVDPQRRAGSSWVAITLLMGALNVVVAEAPSCTEIVVGEKVIALIVAVTHGSTTVMEKRTLSLSVAGVKVVEPPGPLLVIVIVLPTLTG